MTRALHLLLGAGGGIISMALTYPLITISSRLQVQKDKSSKDAYKVQKSIPVLRINESAP